MDFRQNLLESIDCVVIDEVQIAKSIEVKGLMEKINNAEWKFGCTGTLPQSRLDTCQIKSFIGPVIKKYNVKELTEGGFLNKCEINRYLISYRNALKGTLSEVKDQLFENKYRQYIFNNIVKDNEGKNILFLVDRIEKEGKVLEKHLVENFPNHQIKYIHGKIKATDREI
jgi:superfamily II DNA or RNA helicase